jgi:hypothetical protein
MCLLAKVIIQLLFTILYDSPKLEMIQDLNYFFLVQRDTRSCVVGANKCITIMLRRGKKVAGFMSSLNRGAFN